MDSKVIEMWLRRLLCVDFKGKNVIESQLKNSSYLVDIQYSYISVKFNVIKDIEKFPYNVRVPVEMRVFQEESVPIVFLLHMINKYVNELEIITADSSKIDISSLKYQRVEYEINKDLIV